MLYAILATDNAGSLAKRKTARQAHLARLQTLQDEGRLVLAGPLPSIDSPEPGDAGFSGSLIVAEFPDLAAAEQWAAADPYVAADVYREVRVRPFKQTFPA
ncbi:MAG: YciI family protein [Thiocapsa sp.]|nr:YciI family protein [Thiocapsa sp.]MCG6896754.1 YciI family protein [Thiocapsa sp.]MCG6986227.1 YciI family protein [Thiocapsa sp.]